jgi:hypothetical protein
MQGDDAEYDQNLYPANQDHGVIIENETDRSEPGSSFRRCRWSSPHWVDRTVSRFAIR